MSTRYPNIEGHWDDFKEPLVKFGIVFWLLSLPACRQAPHVQKIPASWREPATGMEFVYIPPGHFKMGSAPGEPGRQSDELQHPVEISRGFYLGKYEVTQGEWVKLMRQNPSQFPGCGPRGPMETVTYDDIQVFIARLAERSRAGRFRLPTEAEWEYACRAGTRTAYSTGATLSTAQANFDGRGGENGDPRKFRGKPMPVGSYPPNPWGLYDLHGNLWEWCEDWFADYPAGPARDPKGPAKALAKPVWDARGGDWVYKRVIRGGSWYFNGESCRCALRYTHAPADRGFSLGFRLVREAP
jgi:formylglycine-generating enzyme required for sulfatase activity